MTATIVEAVIMSLRQKNSKRAARRIICELIKSTTNSAHEYYQSKRIDNSMKWSILKSFLNIVFVFSVFAAFMVFAQGKQQDIVYLKNGSIIRGTIIELIPNKTVKITTSDNSLFVFQMDEIEKISKETISTPSKSLPLPQNVSDGIVIGANPLGAILGGVSWISYEKYFGENITFQIRADVWSYKEEENEGGYYYKENQSGFGIGGSLRSYVLGSQPYSGLFGAFGIDAVNTSWNWEERETSYSSPLTGNGTTLTVILSAQFGFAIPISRVRIEPSIVSGYFLLRQKGAGVTGVFVSPAMQIGILF